MHLAETLFRFKGQTSPVVVLAEMDFAEIDEKRRRQLFVGFTRARFRLECVLSDRAERAMARELGSPEFLTTGLTIGR